MSDNDFQRQYETYRRRIDRKLRALTEQRMPASIHRPIRYVLSGGGKRMRSVLVLMSCKAVGGDMRRAMNAAAALEILHNFTLVHDDVMDHADVRRGRPTVHRRWDPNVAILSGDALVALAYRTLVLTPLPNLNDIVRVFTQAFVGVCEGQALDKEFEGRSDVSLREYYSMIARKTGRIIAAAAEIGGMAGGGTKREIQALRAYGRHLGSAFQIRDDVLDIAADARSFGKQLGGDVKEHKKTYLLVTALRRSRGTDRAFLASLRRRKTIAEHVIDRTRRIYTRTGSLGAASAEVSIRTRRAEHALAPISPGSGKAMLLWMAHRLLERES